MKKHSIDEITWIVSQIVNSDLNISLACKGHGITRTTYYRWLKKYGGIGSIHATRMNELKEENGELKRMVVKQALEIQKLKQTRRAWPENGNGGESDKPSSPGFT